MADTNTLVEHLYPGITKDVSDFLKETKHSNQKFNDFDEFQMSPYARRALYVIPVGLDEEDLSEHDSNFDSGLRDIGSKYGISLRLPTWAYQK